MIFHLSFKLIVHFSMSVVTTVIDDNDDDGDVDNDLTMIWQCFGTSTTNFSFPAPSWTV